MSQLNLVQKLALMVGHCIDTVQRQHPEMTKQQVLEALGWCVDATLKTDMEEGLPFERKH